jgi:subtilisin family serine protease
MIFLRCFSRVSILAIAVVLNQLLPAIAVAAPERVIANQYIIQKATSADTDRNTNSIGESPKSSFEVVRIPSRDPLAGPGKSAEQVEDLDWSKVRADCDEILKDPSIAMCEPDIIREALALPNDPGLPLQWWLYDESTSIKGDFGLSLAWDRGTGSASVLLGVIDTGVHYTHPDLAPNMWVNPADPVDGIDNDGNGYVDDKLGVNTYYKDSLPFDCNGHGTHVAGIMGAKGNNALGVSGVNWTTSLIAVSAQRCGFSGFTLSAVLAAYEYFYDLKRRGHNIRAVNASIGGSTPSAIEAVTIGKLASVDIILIAAAGNDGRNVDTQPMYPANYEIENIISVGATNWIVKRSNYSNYGESVDIAAPGGESVSEYSEILSTWSPLATKDTYFKYLRGTSMAAPMVTGTLGLIASQRPYLNGAHLKSMLLSSADSKPALAGFTAGGRYLNAGQMSIMADPPDNCPADPNKLDPAVCGCDVPESYIDSDGDGVLSCLDGCPSDPTKLTPSVCGCGIPDADSNGNGRIDCLEVANSTPAKLNVALSKPKITTAGKKLRIQMQKLANAQYVVEVSSLANSKTKVPKLAVYTRPTNIVQIAKPKRGTKLSIRYYVRMPSSGAQSGWSPVQKSNVK